MVCNGFATEVKAWRTVLDGAAKAPCELAGSGAMAGTASAWPSMLEQQISSFP